MILSKENLDRLSAIEQQLKRNKNKGEYYIQKEYLIDGKHAGWITLCEGIEEDYYVIIGDSEKEMLDARNKDSTNAVIDNINEDTPEPVKEHIAIIPTKEPPKPSTHRASPVPIKNNVKKATNDFDQAAWEHDHIWNIEEGGGVVGEINGY